jgi:hypothetical protein
MTRSAEIDIATTTDGTDEGTRGGDPGGQSVHRGRRRGSGGIADGTTTDMTVDARLRGRAGRRRRGTEDDTAAIVAVRRTAAADRGRAHLGDTTIADEVAADLYHICSSVHRRYCPEYRYSILIALLTYAGTAVGESDCM